MKQAQMVELADTPVSGTGAARLGGSSPPLGISFYNKKMRSSRLQNQYFQL